MSITMTPAAPALEMIDITLIDPTPLNPRAKPKEAKIQEMADSIRSKGVEQPIRLRPHPKKPGRYELLAGERRYHGAMKAKASHVPAIVSDDDDKTAVLRTISENFERLNLTPMEEAKGFRNAMKVGVTAAELAASLGISVQIVNRRVKLLELVDSWTLAMDDPDHAASRWPAELLEVVSPLAGPLQQDLFDRIFDHWESVEFSSPAQLRKFIDEEFMRDLRRAEWDLSDPNLVAGAPACDECPLRCARQPELFGPAVDDEPDRCQDGDCFNEKRVEHYRRLVAEKAPGGEKVMALFGRDGVTGHESAFARALTEAGVTVSPEGYSPAVRKSGYRQVAIGKKTPFDPKKHAWGLIVSGKSHGKVVVYELKQSSWLSGAVSPAAEKPKKKMADLPPKQQLAEKVKRLENKRFDLSLQWVRQAFHVNIQTSWDGKGNREDLRIPSDLDHENAVWMRERANDLLLHWFAGNPSWCAMMLAVCGKSPDVQFQCAELGDIGERLELFGSDRCSFADLAERSLESVMMEASRAHNQEQAREKWGELVAFVQRLHPEYYKDGPPLESEVLIVDHEELMRRAEAEIPEPKSLKKLREGIESKASVRKAAKNKAKPKPKRDASPKTDKPTPGVCRVCGCTEDNACMNAFDTPCSWVDETRTLCSNVDCVAAARDEKKPARKKAKAKK